MKATKELEELQKKGQLTTYRDNDTTLILILGDSEKFFETEIELEKDFSKKKLDYSNFYQKLKEKMTDEFDFLIL